MGVPLSLHPDSSRVIYERDLFVRPCDQSVTLPQSLGFSTGQFECSRYSSGEKAKAMTQQRDLNSPECSPNSDEPLTWTGGYSERRGHRFGLLQSELGCEILLLSKPPQACWNQRRLGRAWGSSAWLLPPLSPASPIRRRRKITAWQRQFSALTGAAAEPRLKRVLSVFNTLMVDRLCVRLLSTKADVNQQTRTIYLFKPGLRLL